MAKAVLGVFQSEDRAKDAISELKKQGFDEREISLVAKEKESLGGDDDEHSGGLTMEQQNLSEGIMTGGALGGIAGLLAGAEPFLYRSRTTICRRSASFLTGVVGGDW